MIPLLLGGCLLLAEPPPGARPDGSEDSGTAEDTLDPAEVHTLWNGSSSVCVLDGAGRRWCTSWDDELLLEDEREHVYGTGDSIYTCVVLADGAVECDGEPGPEGEWIEVDIGGTFECVLGRGGEIRCWGWKYDDPPGTFGALATGSDFVCAIDEAERLRCFGSTWADAVDEAPVTTALAVGAGFSGACAIGTSGRITCWADDDLAKGVPSGSDFVDLAVGSWHACALRSDGTVSCWGDDDYLQSEDPPGTFREISATNSTSCGIPTDGGIRCWGRYRFEWP